MENESVKLLPETEKRLDKFIKRAFRKLGFEGESKEDEKTLSDLLKAMYIKGFVEGQTINQNKEMTS